MCYVGRCIRLFCASSCLASTAPDSPNGGVSSRTWVRLGSLGTPGFQLLGVATQGKTVALPRDAMNGNPTDPGYREIDGSNLARLGARHGT